MRRSGRRWSARPRGRSGCGRGGGTGRCCWRRRRARRRPSTNHFCLLEPDGGVQRGPHLPGYQTSYPALTDDGRALFWRDGALRSVDAELEHRVLLAGGTLADDEDAGLGRLLLLDDGTLACTVSRYADEVFSAELVLVGSSFRPAVGAAWPCGDGDAGGNPVVA